MPGYETWFKITNLFPYDAELMDDVFVLKNNNLIMKKGDSGKSVYFIARHRKKWSWQTFNDDSQDEIKKYLAACALVSGRVASLSESDTIEISDSEQLGTKTHTVRSSIKISRVSQEEKSKLRKDFQAYLNFTKEIYEKYCVLNDEVEFLKIASEYCYRARTGSATYDSSFIDAMIAMEALFNENPDNITYKISIRGAFVLGLVGFDHRMIMSELAKLYRLRSKVVHGGGVRFTVNYSLDIETYARWCLICFYIFCHHRKGKSRQKGKILAEIDLALIDGQKAQELGNEIRESLPDFVRHGLENTVDDSYWRTPVEQSS